jgi:hypothetical protein
MKRLTLALLLGSLADILIGVPADASTADRTKARQTAQSVVGQPKPGARLEREA